MCEKSLCNKKQVPRSRLSAKIIPSLHTSPGQPSTPVYKAEFTAGAPRQVESWQSQGLSSLLPTDPQQPLTTGRLSPRPAASEDSLAGLHRCFITFICVPIFHKLHLQSSVEVCGYVFVLHKHSRLSVAPHVVFWQHSGSYHTYHICHFRLIVVMPTIYITYYQHVLINLWAFCNFM